MCSVARAWHFDLEETFKATRLSHFPLNLESSLLASWLSSLRFLLQYNEKRRMEMQFGSHATNRPFIIAPGRQAHFMPFCHATNSYPLSPCWCPPPLHSQLWTPLCGINVSLKPTSRLFLHEVDLKHTHFYFCISLRKYLSHSIQESRIAHQSRKCWPAEISAMGNLLLSFILAQSSTHAKKGSSQWQRSLFYTLRLKGLWHQSGLSWTQLQGRLKVRPLPYVGPLFIPFRTS
jgi:hypothetical protein